MYSLKNGETIKCQFISLEKDVARREAFLRQKDSKYFEWFIGVSFEENGELKLFNEGSFENLYSRKAMPGEIGCTLSHYILLNEFAQSEDACKYLLVAEDDAVFEENIFEVVESLVNIIPENGVVILGRPHTSEGGVYDYFGYDEHMAQLSLLSPKVGKARKSNYKMGIYRGEVWGTGLYLMTRSAARNYVDFVNRSGGIHWVADHWEYYKYPAFLDVRLLEPSLCGFKQNSSIREISPSLINSNDNGMSMGIRGGGGSGLQRIKSNLAFRTRIKRSKWIISATLKDISNRMGKR